MAQLNKIGRHATIVRADLDKKVIWFKTGGWYTPTTKNRMNQTLNQFGIPLRVFQKAGQWFIERTYLADGPDKISAFKENTYFNYPRQF